MNISIILAAIAGFLATPIGVKVMIWLWKKLGVVVENTETKLDDSLYNASPDLLDEVVEHFDLGTADEILQNFLKGLEETDEDTTELEEEIKAKQDEIKK